MQCPDVSTASLHLSYQMQDKFMLSKNEGTKVDTRRYDFFYGEEAWNCRNHQVAVYFDHKIADEPSTFLRAYNYGFVVPKNYDIVNYYPRYNEKVKPQLIYQNDLAYVNLQYYRLFEKYYNTREMPNSKQTIGLIPKRQLVQR